MVEIDDVLVGIFQFSICIDVPIQSEVAGGLYRILIIENSQPYVIIGPRFIGT